MAETNCSTHIEQLVEHYLKMFDGRILLDAKEAAVVLDSTSGALAVNRCKKIGPPFLRVGGSIKYNLFALADYIRNPGCDAHAEHRVVSLSTR